MNARAARQSSVTHYDRVVEDARARAYEALRDHQGVLRSMTPDQRRAANQIDPGPTQEVGRPPTRR